VQQLFGHRYLSTTMLYSIFCTGVALGSRAPWSCWQVRMRRCRFSLQTVRSHVSLR
jgi:hypothetical protein